jgi:hypothetical protein
MVYWGNPITAAEAPAPVAAEGAIASVVLQTDLELEFGAHFDISQAQLDLATQKVEEHLQRPLRNAVWTHRCRIIYDGYVDAVFGAAGAVRPPAIPIQQVFAPAGTQVVDFVEVRYVPPDDIMLGFWGYTWIEQWGTLTYQGGWTPETIPSELRTVILKVAIRMHQRRHPGSQMDVTTPGVLSPRLGDVSFSTDKNYGGLFDDNDYHVMKGYRYKPVL